MYFEFISLKKIHYPCNEYGIMIAQNKCEVYDFKYGYDIHYIEENEYSV